MNLLITGGAGFIGSNLIRHIINRPDITRLVNLDCLTYAGHLANLTDVSDNPKYVFEKVDLRDKSEVLRVVQQHQITHVMHLAAESHVDRSISGPGDFIQTNIVGTFNLLEACREQWLSPTSDVRPASSTPSPGGLELRGEQRKEFAGGEGSQEPKNRAGSESLGRGEGVRSSFSPGEKVDQSTNPTIQQSNNPPPAPRFHHVSTDEVYGSLGATGYFTETTPYAPNSPYSASKASSDMLVRAYHHTYGLPTVITNCSNNYGPYQFPEKLIPVVILSVLNRKPVPVYGDGMNVRDWLFVLDHAEALWKSLTTGREGETYNIGGNNEWPNIRIVELICDLIDELVPQLGGDSRKLITFVKDRPGHDRRYAIDSSKIARDLGWKPAYTFEQGIRETVKWYLSNKNWISTVTKK